MQKAIDLFFRALEAVLVLCLAAMLIMVFGNVVLRYFFNSGITISEELSRFLFVWLTFVGAVVAMREGGHLGVDTLVRLLPRAGKVVCFVASELLILFCCVLFFWGTWQQHELHVTNLAPVTGIPMTVIYGVGYLTGAAIAVMVVTRLVRLARGRLRDEELIQVHESEDDAVIASLAANRKEEKA